MNYKLLFLWRTTMKNSKLLCIIPIFTMTFMLAGCGTDALKDEMQAAQASGNNIQITTDITYTPVEKASLDWVELDQLKTFKSLRRKVDSEVNILAFDLGSKNGVLYVDLDSNWAGNNTLYNAMQNKAFVVTYWNVGTFKTMLADAAKEEFSDIQTEGNGITAAVNAYWNIIPYNKDKTSGLTNMMTRAEAMSAIVRADTPVTWIEPNEEYYKAVGDGDYTSYAFLATENSFLDYKNGSLNYSTFNAPITKAEAIYIIVSRYWPDELANATGTSDLGMTNSLNAGDVATKLGLKDGQAWQAYEMDYCIQTGVGCPSDLYAALEVAQKHGLVDSSFDWDSGVAGGWLLDRLLTAYSNIYNNTNQKLNAKMGANAGQSLLVVEVVEEKPEEPERTEVSLVGSVISSVRDVTDLDDLLRVYGDEIDMTPEELDEIRKNTEGWTFSPADKWMEVAYCNGLNIRTGPSTDYRIRGCVPPGTKAHIVAICNENGWYRIIANGKIVYQCGIYFKDFEGSEEYEMRTGENANN